MREFWFDLASRIAADAFTPHDHLFRSKPSDVRETNAPARAQESLQQLWIRRPKRS
jgi:hypothetical protein